MYLCSLNLHCQVTYKYICDVCVGIFRQLTGIFVEYGLVLSGNSIEAVIFGTISDLFGVSRDGDLSLGTGTATQYFLDGINP